MHSLCHLKPFTLLTLLDSPTFVLPAAMSKQHATCLCLVACTCLSACQYDMVGPEGIVESHQITRDGKAGATEAVDCKWYIRAPPRSKVSDLNRHTGVEQHFFFSTAHKRMEIRTDESHQTPDQRAKGKMPFLGFGTTQLPNWTASLFSD